MDPIDQRILELFPEQYHAWLLDDAWRIVYTTRPKHFHSGIAKQGHWQFVHVALKHASVSMWATRSFDYDMDFDLRPGQGYLRDQIASLPLFSLEIGALLYYPLAFVGPSEPGQPGKQREYGTCSTFDFPVPGLLGYDVVADVTWDESSKRLNRKSQLVQMDGKEKMTLVKEVSTVTQY